MTKKPMLKIILIAIPTVIVVFIIIVAMQPSSYRVMRSLVIAAPPDALFPHMNDLKKWEV
ncbi:MAG: polyketide cyclase, partial [Verrucomicrobia bacterium]